MLVALRFFLVIMFTVPLLLAASASAGEVVYDLVIEEQPWNVTGRPATAMTIHGSVPGPVLRFTEGDQARIRVHNRMAVETSIHWHGLLVPPGMDGVPLLSFPPIAPGATFTYQFPIRQSGTYWYHSHTSLQEQRGVYGAIVIQPEKVRLQADRDFVVLLSDWTDRDPYQVLRELKRGSEWFALEKGSAQSIVGAARLGMLGDFFKRELQRMPAMDIADVAYDRFLANGRPQLHLDARPGETVRLRLVDGSATTYFHLQFAGSPLQIVAADGMDVEPVEEELLLMAVAETYDVVVRLPQEPGAYELRATAHDGSGYASIWLGAGPPQPAPDLPKPNLYHAMGGAGLASLFALTPAAVMGMDDGAVAAGRFDRPGTMMHGMEHGPQVPAATPAGHGMEHSPESGHHPMPAMEHRTRGAGMAAGPPESKEHSGHTGAMAMPRPPPVPEREQGVAGGQKGRRFAADFRPMAADVSSAPALAVDGMDPRRPGPPYDRLRSPTPTAFRAGQPVREIRLTLDGNMERYTWTLNNRILAETDVISIRAGEAVRLILINRTMMHHPMHLHGHFFRVLNGQGEHAPLKHTVDVAPMATTVIEFDAGEPGDWFFHCHLLYHMKSGMARVVHYEGFEPPPEVAALRRLLYHDPWYFWGEAGLWSNMSEGYLRASASRQALVAEWEAGWQRVEETEWDALLALEIYGNGFLVPFAGLAVEGEGDEVSESRGVFGVRYLLPLSIESRFRLETDGGGRFELEKEIALTPRLSLTGEAECDTEHAAWEGKGALSYALSRAFSLEAGYHSEFGWGGGLALRF